MSPFKPASTLTDDDVHVLHDAIRVVLGDAVDRSRGLAAAELKGEKKSHLAVHGRTGQKCPVCGEHPTITHLIDYEQFCGVPAHDRSEFKEKNAQMAVRTDRRNIGMRNRSTGIIGAG